MKVIYSKINLEQWKDVKGFEGYYQISSYGRLKSFKSDKDGKILKNTNKNGGYFSYNLFGKDKKRKTIKMHRLVAEHFIENPHKKPQVNHIDGNKQNNNVLNLEWVTVNENIKHAIDTGLSDRYFLKKLNISKSMKKLVMFNKYGKVIKHFDCAKDASLYSGVCLRNIHHCLSGQRETAGGYVWKYESEVVKS